MPAKKNISKEELISLYIEENMSLLDVARHFGVSEATLVRNLKIFGIKKPNNKKQENREKTFLDKYGHTFKDFISSDKRNEVLQKAWGEEAREKRAKTNIEKYGVENVLSSEIIRKKIASTNIEKYGNENVLKSSVIKSKIEDTNLQKYGVKNVFESQEIQDKIKETNLKKYGAENPMQSDEVLNKMIKTFNTKFGGDSPMCSDDVKEKSKQTCLQKYGTENVGKSDIVAKKREQTFLKKYGVKNVGQSKVFQRKAQFAVALKYKRLNFSQIFFSDETLQIINDKQSFRNFIKDNRLNKVADISKRLNISQTTTTRYLHKYDSWDLIDNSVSKGEIELGDFLRSIGVKYIKTRGIIPPYEIDLYCPDYNIGIEFNGDYWHSSLFVDKTYHYNKAKLAEQNGVRLIQIYEHQWNDPRVRPIIESLLWV